MKTNTTCKLFGLSVLIICSLSVFSATITSIKSGVWTESTTWDSGTIPTINDDVIIISGHTVSSLISSNSAVTTDFCRNLTVNGVFQISNAKNINYTAVIYGSIECNGSIELGQTPGYGAIISYKGIVEPGKGLTGNGTAICKTLTVATSKKCDFLINLPVLTCVYGFSIVKDSSNVIIAEGSTVGGSTSSGITLVSVASTQGQGSSASNLEVNGSLTCGTLYICNNDSTSRKSMITVKNSGTLNVMTSITPIRGTGTGVIGTIGGSGIKLSVENGGKFNFPVLFNPIQFTESSAGQSYDPKLIVAYYTGSIINGTTTTEDLIKGDIQSEVYNPLIQIDAFYNNNNRIIELSRKFENLKVYNTFGQMIFSYRKPESKVEFPFSFNGNYILVLTDDAGKNYSTKFMAK